MKDFQDLFDLIRELSPQFHKVLILEAISRNSWCVVPPNQETEDWSVYKRFDGEFGLISDEELGTGYTLVEAVESAIAGSIAAGPAAADDKPRAVVPIFNPDAVPQSFTKPYDARFENGQWVRIPKGGGE